MISKEFFMSVQTGYRAKQHRRGYRRVDGQRWPYVDVVGGLVTSAISLQNQKETENPSFIKRKSNGDLRIVKVVNNLLRNTVVITYLFSELNPSMVIDVDFKRYRRNTVDKFGQPCCDTVRKRYDLDSPQQSFAFVRDVEEHMRICPDNLKTNNEQLNLRMHGFDHIGEDSLYAMEIYSFDLIPSENGVALESSIELLLASDRFTRDFTIKVKDIINFNDISTLVGQWVVFNFKDAFKIKSKEELKASYHLLH